MPEATAREHGRAGAKPREVKPGLFPMRCKSDSPKPGCPNAKPAARGQDVAEEQGMGGALKQQVGPWPQ
jgi:hypothetical protein